MSALLFLSITCGCSLRDVFRVSCFTPESTESHVRFQKRSVIANETLAWQVLDNFPGLLLLHIQVYYFSDEASVFEESASRAAEKSCRSRRVVCLSSQISLICARAAWSERRTQTLIFCRPYLSRARDCRTSHGVALVNTLRVRFSSDIPPNDWSTNVYSATDCHAKRLSQFLTY